MNIRDEVEAALVDAQAIKSDAQRITALEAENAELLDTSNKHETNWGICLRAGECLVEQRDRLKKELVAANKGAQVNALVNQSLVKKLSIQTELNTTLLADVDALSKHVDCRAEPGLHEPCGKCQVCLQEQVRVLREAASDVSEMCPFLQCHGGIADEDDWTEEHRALVRKVGARVRAALDATRPESPGKV